MITVLGLAHFAPLLSMYDFEGRRAMAVYIANNVVDNDTYIATAEQTEVVLGLLAPLIQGKTQLALKLQLHFCVVPHFCVPNPQHLAIHS